MRKVISLLIAMLFICIFTSLSFAVEEKKAVRKVVRQITGEVKAVDKWANTITVVKKMKRKTIRAYVTVDDKTKITKAGEERALTDVRVGDKVVVAYTEIGDKNVAKSVAIEQTEKK